jgi:hypothetical protein
MERLGSWFWFRWKRGIRGREQAACTSHQREMTERLKNENKAWL